jgi:hypothetical protein
MRTRSPSGHNCNRTRPNCGVTSSLVGLVVIALSGCAARENGATTGADSADSRDAGTDHAVEHAGSGGGGITAGGAAGQTQLMGSAGDATAGASGLAGAASLTGGASGAGNAGSSSAGSPSGVAGAGVAAAGASSSTAGAGGSNSPGTAGAGVGGAMANQPVFDCSRPGLSALVNAYFAALEAHDATRLPLAPTARITEDAKPIKAGDGLWMTAGKLTAHRNALDTERCGTLTIAVLDNAGNPLVVGVRLRLEGQQVTEIESFTAKAIAQGAPSALDDSAAGEWSNVLPAGETTTRSKLDEIANNYLDAQGGASALPPVDSSCTTAANGVVTGMGASCVPFALPASPLFAEGKPTSRRFPLADLEAGIAVGFGLSIASQPTVQFDMIKVVGGKIQTIHAFWGQPTTSWGWN